MCFYKNAFPGKFNYELRKRVAITIDQCMEQAIDIKSNITNSGKMKSISLELVASDKISKKVEFIISKKVTLKNI